MDVIIVSSSTNISGGTRQALYLAQSFKEEKHRVIFFTYPNAKIRLQDPAIEWVDLPKNILHVYKSIMYKINVGENTVLHAFHNYAVKMAAYFGTWWYLKKLPIVCIAHRGVTAKPGNPLPYLLPGIRAYTVNSSMCAEMLPVLMKKEKVHVVNNAVPESRTEARRAAGDVKAELHIPSEDIVIGNICNDNPLKGAGELIQAYAYAKKKLPRESILLIVGATKDRWTSLTRKLDIYDNVRFISTQHVADYLQIMDLFVFSSHFIESQPNVILEAMSMGLPIVASNVGGVNEILEPQCLFYKKDTVSMSEKIVEFITDRALFSSSAMRNKEASLVYTSKNRLNHIRNIYNETLQDNMLRRLGKKMHKEYEKDE